MILCYVNDFILDDMKGFMMIVGNDFMTRIRKYFITVVRKG